MSQLIIGNVIRIESGKIDVWITTRQREVLHDGITYRVGQLGSYITIRQGDRTIVGFITKVRCTELTAGQDEPQLIIEAQLLGEIIGQSFSRGVNAYPIIGDEVWLAVRSDFEVIFGSFEELIARAKHPKSFTMGRFAFNPEFEVKVLGSEFFAKHAAVLGNSGSGKSCTTTRVLQELTRLPEAQVVLFDMHGEYKTAFMDANGRIDPNVTYLGVDDLVLPYWMLRYEELEALFIDKSNPLHVTTQISFLRTALLEFKLDAAKELGLARSLTLDTPVYFSLDALKTYAENLNEARFVLNEDRLAFTQLALRSMPAREQQKLMRTQRCSFNRGNPEGETPHPLYFGKLLGLIDQVDTKFSDRRYEFMLRPLEHSERSHYFRGRMAAADSAGKASTLMNYFIRLLTGRLDRRSNLTIVDLSGIPFEIVDITVAVLSRLLFDLNFWTPAKQRHPILLCYEEAHNYIPRETTGRNFAKKAVERVAKEGRKYGVTAMIISQRPSELSETVLAQCNNLVVMRMNNPEDQQYVTRVVSDHFSNLIQMLPILRPGEAFVIGDSVLMPMRTLVQIPTRLPQSGNLDFFRIWSTEQANSDIDDVIDHWRRQDRERLDADVVRQAAEREAAAAATPAATAHPALRPSQLVAGYRPKQTV